MRRPNNTFALFLLIFSWLTASYTSAETQQSVIQSAQALETKLGKIFEETQATAMSVAIIDQHKIVLQKTWGHTNLEKGSIADNNTLFRIGSITKMFTSLSALKLVEEGKLDLNAKLSELTPEIEYQNPWQDTHPILFSHLLEHTTGWDDSHLKEYAFTSPEPLTLTEGLPLFPDSRTSRWPPGTRSSYCNTGPAVAAYIIEKITGIPFEEYVQNTFFNPINMQTATYFYPKDLSFANAYIFDRPQDYWEILYRPTGAINASITEMTSFLQFMINRGETDNRRIVQSSSIDRMEISKTSLGAEQGITAGYGLSNYSTGYRQKHIDFHGHSGGVIGGWSNLGYNSNLKSGFIVMATGSPLAISQSSNAAMNFITRNQEKPKTNVGKQKISDRINGYYRSIAPRNEQIRIINDLTAIFKISPDNDELVLSPLLGKTETPLKYYTGDNGVWISHKSGLPAIAQVNDPLVGKALRAGPYFLKPISALSAWLPIIFFVLFALLNVAAIFNILFVTPYQHFRKTLNRSLLKIRLFPLASTIILIATVILASGGNETIFSLGIVSAHSISLFILSILYAFSAIIGGGMLYRLKGSSKATFSYWFIYIHGGSHIALAIYLMSYGLIGIRTWA